MRWIILSYLIANPFIYWIGKNHRSVQELSYQLSSVIVFSLGLFFKQKELKFSKLNASIGVLMLAFIFAWFRTMKGFFVAENLLFGILAYITIIKTISKEDIEFILKGVAYFAIFCVAVLAFQVAGFDFRGCVIDKGVPYIPHESIFFNYSSMGMFFAQIVPMLLPLTPFSLLLAIPMYWGKSIAAYLGLASGILFFMWFRKRLFFWVFLALFIAAMGLSCSSPKMIGEFYTDFNIRLSQWSIVTQDIFQHPIGYGLDSFANPPDGLWRYYHYNSGQWGDKSKHLTIKAVNNNGTIKGFTDFDDKCFKNVLNGRGYVEYNDHPHNEYLWLGYEVGAWAWIVLGFIFYFLWQRFRLSRRDVLSVASMIVIIVYVVECFLQFPFHLSRIGSFFPFVLGVFYIATED